MKNYDSRIYGEQNQNGFGVYQNVNEKFLNELEGRLHFKMEKIIKFVGTVYDQDLLMKICENAYGHLHGHEIGEDESKPALGTGSYKFTIGYKMKSGGSNFLYIKRN